MALTKTHNRMIAGAPVNVKDFGAAGDGVTDDTAAIQGAIGTGDVSLYFPIGTYMVDGIDLTGVSNLTLMGESKNLSILKLIDNSNDHVIALSSSSTINISTLKIDGNRANQTGGHGIRFGGADGVTIDNVVIRGCYSYGIGMQAGTNSDITISNFTILDTGQDGIDIKDYDLANDNIIITNGVIKNYGNNVAGQVGVDCRGPVNISNLQIEASNTDTRGFRFRVESVQGRAGSGVANNINVVCTGTNAYGFNTEGLTVKDLAISNINVRGGFLGVLGSQGVLYSNLVSDGALATEALSYSGTNNIINGLKISDCAGRGVDVEASATANNISNFFITGVGGTEAIRIDATATDCSFTDGHIQSGKLLSDYATGTTIRNVKNWKTSGNYESVEIPVDSTGSKAFTISHDLDVTPNEEDISLTMVRATGLPTDYTIQYLHLEGTSSSNFGVRFRVNGASGTAGATVKVVAQVRAKNS